MTERSLHTRRGVLASGTALLGSLAGCADALRDGDDVPTPALDEFRGDTRLVGERPVPGGPRIDSLPGLDGRLTVYLAESASDRYERLVALFERTYPGFEPTLRIEPAAVLVAALREQAEAGNVRADVFLATDAAAVDALADDDLTAPLSDDVAARVPPRFRPTDTWVGVGAHSRALAYDATAFDAGGVPTSIDAVASEVPASIAWAPRSYGFRTFVTALRSLAGREAAREWLLAVLAADTETVDGEFFAANAVARGDAALALCSHQDVLRVRAGRPDAGPGLAFTENDAGALVNATAAAVLRASNATTLAHRFVRHLLSAEAQEYVATDALAYPVTPGVEPVAALPPLDALTPPAVSLAALGDVRPTTSLLREVGVLP
ncbi:extracellular solute-binding protein [Salarchaeum sp. JOR-1]|uniref:extracellular solute-binding protein n=1 Tax=Salarchaeum sp. JOR-1 TaxID=2599399 RepID=UPI0011987822|nr:extracellular solute-binding protein [Salarchaeum sp. JOR-1]QDX41258.1 extracellular solute-binding protein [Salarchaeum sp. JOR-1]